MTTPLYELLNRLKGKRTLTSDEQRLMQLLDVAQARLDRTDLSHTQLRRYI